MRNNRRSGYRMGWLFVMFDLPTDTAEERRLATKFRNDLLDEGFLMFQYSIYIRSAVTLDKKESYISYLKKINPNTGSIKCLFITDTQWGQIETISNEIKDNKRNIKEHPQIYEQLQFW